MKILLGMLAAASVASFYYGEGDNGVILILLFGVAVMLSGLWERL